MRLWSVPLAALLAAYPVVRSPGEGLVVTLSIAGFITVVCTLAVRWSSIEVLGVVSLAGSYLASLLLGSDAVDPWSVLLAVLLWLLLRCLHAPAPRDPVPERDPAVRVARRTYDAVAMGLGTLLAIVVLVVGAGTGGAGAPALVFGAALVLCCLTLLGGATHRLLRPRSPLE